MQISASAGVGRRLDAFDSQEDCAGAIGSICGQCAQGKHRDMHFSRNGTTAHINAQERDMAAAIEEAVFAASVRVFVKYSLHRQGAETASP